MSIMAHRKWRRLAFILLFAQAAFSFGAGKEEAKEAGKPLQVEVVFETTLGSFTMALYPDQAPVTVANFLSYVDQGFYTDTLVHRVIPRFVIQGGGFETGMKLKPTFPPVKNESDNGLKNVLGTVAMARTRDPDSATSQFFINLKHNVSLDAQGKFPGYTVFGKVIEGLDVIRSMAETPTVSVDRHSDVPQEDIVILATKRKMITRRRGITANL